MPIPTKAGPQVVSLLNEIKEKNHLHLAQALVAVQFMDSKAYIHDRLNLGKVSKFSGAVKLWLPNDAKYDFLITLCADVWYGLFNEKQKEAWLDLLLTRCQVRYEPNTVVVNGKSQVVKDEFGRVEYTDKVKYDEAGVPLWKVSPLDISVISKNISRFGQWYEDLVELKVVMDKCDKIG